MQPTRHLIVSGQWIKAKAGKWHLSTQEKDPLYEPAKSLCGLTFEPFNVTWGEAPPTNDNWICQHCAKHLVTLAPVGV